MPIKPSAEKALRQTKKRAGQRAKALADLELVLRQMKRVLTDKKKKEAGELMTKIQKMIDKAAKTRLIAKNKASRLKSQLMKQLAKI